jgi:hypothetical protein
MLTEAALDVPALVIEGAREALPEGSSTRRLRPAPPGVAAVQGDDAAFDAKFVPAEAMVMLGVVARISQHRVQSYDGRGLAQGGREVLAGADASDRADDQMRVGMQHCGQLGPGTLPVA